MKPFNNLNEALTYQLEGLHDAEKQLQVAMPKIVAKTNSEALKKIVESYEPSAGDKRLKLKRTFGYLLSGPFGKQNKAMAEMIDELSFLADEPLAPEIKDALLASGLSTIVHYKISGYSSAMLFALALELHPVADLLSEILEWERETDQALTRLLSKLSNKASKATVSTVKH